MSDVYTPRIAIWLTRLAADEAISESFRLDPVAFAGWYAMIGEALLWPAEVRAIQQAERDKKLSLDRMMKLLNQVNYAFAGRTSTDHARRVLEGYAVHDWVKHHGADLRAIAGATLSSVEDMESFNKGATRKVRPFVARLTELGTALGLTELEQDILSFSALCTTSEEFAGVFEQMAGDRWTAERLWTVIFGATREDLAKALRPTSELRLSGLLRSGGRRSQLGRISNCWVELLAGSDTLLDAIVEPLTTKIGSGMPARLQEDDLRLATAVLKNAKEKGVNLLLYGAASLEKRHLLRDIVIGAQRAAWRVRKFEDANRQDLPTLAYVAFALLARHSVEADTENVLVVERPADVLQTSAPEYIRAMFGIEFSNEDIPPFDEHLLTTNTVPAIWLASDAGSLPEDTLARFVFHAQLKKADKEQRRLAVQERLQGLKLGKKAHEELLKLEGVSSAQLEAAAKAARLLGAKTKRDRDDAIVQAVRRSQKALSRDIQAKAKLSVTQYSLKYINAAGRFGPEELLKAFRKKPRGTVALYGPPGTGKTQFVEYLATELGRPLLIKRASDLLSKWLSETEKNIAAAFEEAANEDAILLLDEGDSFLRSRENAQHSWEVTQVNELLQHMERFEGIVVVCTNLFSGLDAAALRRFTFKVEFRPLDADQRWEMFVNESGLKGQLTKLAMGTREQWWDRLCLMLNLTAGDFATVKRQCDLLDLQLTPVEWLEQLELECKARAQAQTPAGRKLG